MSNIFGTGTVFNLPNFAGQLYTATPAVTPFLSLIRGNAVKTDNFQFSTGVEYSHEAPSQPAISENDSLNAPAAVSYVRSQNTNVTQIFHEKVSVTYAKQSSGGRLSGVSSSLEGNCAPNELDFQTARALEKIARDVEYTFINGVYQLAGNSSQANKTRGMLEAVGTVVDCNNAVLSQRLLDSAFKAAYDAGADFTDMVLVCSPAVKQYLSTIYASQAGFNLPDSRNVGGTFRPSKPTSVPCVSCSTALCLPVCCLARISPAFALWNRTSPTRATSSVNRSPKPALPRNIRFSVRSVLTTVPHGSTSRSPTSLELF